MARCIILFLLVTNVLGQDTPTLEGTVISANHKIAVFSLGANGAGKTVRARVNDKIGLFKLESIERDRVVVSKDGLQRVMHVFTGKHRSPVTKVKRKKPRNARPKKEKRAGLATRQPMQPPRDDEDDVASIAPLPRKSRARGFPEPNAVEQVKPAKPSMGRLRPPSDDIE